MMGRKNVSITGETAKVSASPMNVADANTSAVMAAVSVTGLSHTNTRGSTPAPSNLRESAAHRKLPPNT
jgi:hypothetical protein